ncbi:MAG: glycosyltransferase family 4 protein [Chloroflexi bacterium]|nr:glycosyltransferase family 4 protein [Chloroflexota bacterium]
MKNYKKSEPKKLRVGFDARMVYYRQAGIGQYILNLLGELAPLQAEQNFSLTVYQSRKEARLPTEWLKQPNTKLASRKLWTPPHHRLEQVALPLELAWEGPAVFHSPDFIPPFIRPTSSFNPLTGFRKIGSVITIHDLAFLHFPHLLTQESARYYGQVEKGAKSAEWVIAVSESTARDVVNELGIDPEKIRVIYEAANPLFRPLSEPELVKLEEGAARKVVAKLREQGLNPADGFLLFVSTLEPRKNLPTLLRAYRHSLDEFPADVPPPRLVLAGREGWLFAEIYRLAEELGLQKELIWTGGVETTELLWLYNRATCLAMPSLYEGFGLPPLEALACGTPALVAATSSLPEVVGEVGQKIPPEDVSAWATALHYAWTERLVRKAEMRQRGPVWAARFSWRKAALETLEVYKLLNQDFYFR